MGVTTAALPLHGIDRNGANSAEPDVRGMLACCGIGLVALGLAELAWIVHANVRRSFAFQAAMLAELGLMFAIGSLFHGAARAGVMVTLGVVAVLSLLTQLELRRKERRESDKRL